MGVTFITQEHDKMTRHALQAGPFNPDSSSFASNFPVAQQSLLYSIISCVCVPFSSFTSLNISPILQVASLFCLDHWGSVLEAPCSYDCQKSIQLFHILRRILLLLHLKDSLKRKKVKIDWGRKNVQTRDEAHLENLLILKLLRQVINWYFSLPSSRNARYIRFISSSVPKPKIKREIFDYAYC